MSRLERAAIGGLTSFRIDSRESRNAYGRSRIDSALIYHRSLILQHLLHCAQERRWPLADPASTSFESGTSQTSIQDVKTDMHNQMDTARGLVCSG